VTASVGVQAFIFDIGWGELVIIGVVALIVIGPKELPTVLRTFGQYMTKIRRMAAEFQSQFQEAMREAEMAELKQQFDAIHDAAKDIRNFDPVGTARDQIEGAVADKPAETAPSGPAAATPTQSPEPASTVPEAAAESRPPETSSEPGHPAPAGTPEPAAAPGAPQPPSSPPPSPAATPEPAAAAVPAEPEARKGQPG